MADEQTAQEHAQPCRTGGGAHGLYRRPAL